MKQIINPVYFLLLLVFMTMCSNKPADIPRDKQAYIPIYVTPYYYDEPLSINVGEYSNRLLSNNPQKMLELSATIKKNIDEVNIQTLYVLAIRLYDLNEKDEAVYWYFTAKVRAGVVYYMQEDVERTLGNPAFELRSALNSFSSLSSEYIIAYSINDIDKFITTLEKVKKENTNISYVSKLYPKLKFKPQSEQLVFEEDQMKGIDSLIKYMKENRDEIMAKSKESGVEGKN